MLKKKNIYVISVSVVIVLLVILSSFLGLVIYFQWRQLDMAYKYYERLEESDTIFYAKNIELEPLKIRLSGFKKIGLIDGGVNNKGKRTVISIALRVNFLDSANKPVFSSVIYPLEPFQPPRMFKKMRFTYFAFLKGPVVEPNKSIRFKYPLWHCPKKFLKMVRKGSFSDKAGEWCGNISAEVIKIKLKPA
jgi:hypothetical protein